MSVSGALSGTGDSTSTGSTTILLPLNNNIRISSSWVRIGSCSNLISLAFYLYLLMFHIRETAMLRFFKIVRDIVFKGRKEFQYIIGNLFHTIGRSAAAGVLISGIHCSCLRDHCALFWLFSVDLLTFHACCSSDESIGKTQTCRVNLGDYANGEMHFLFLNGFIV